jgi:hypothetical protein
MTLSESELIDEFVEDIHTYPFKTHIEHEKNCKAGRIDLSLPDYDIVIEAKSDGSIKKAIGQALSYSVTTGLYGYILIPHKLVSDWVVESCKRADVGIVTTSKNSLNFSLVHDVGGFESFHPHHYENISYSDSGVSDCRYTEVVGGVDEITD